MTPIPNHTVDGVVDRLFCCEEIIYRHPPKILVLHGSLRTPSYSRFVAEEGGRVLTSFGAEVRFFSPAGLPIFEGIETLPLDDRYQKVRELRDLVAWSEAQFWSVPEIHGNMPGVFKNQIDWIPLKENAIRPTQGKLLALSQVTGGSQSFNVVNNLRVLGRWMRMFVIPNQSSVAKAYQQFDEFGIMRDSPYRARLIDVMEELFKFTLLLRGNIDYLVQRYSEEVIE